MTKRAGKKRSPGVKYRGVPTEADANGTGTPKATGDGDIVVHPPQYTFVGPGKDTALVKRAIQDGWDIPQQTKKRLLNRLFIDADRNDITLEQRINLGKFYVQIERLKVESAKLDLAAKAMGLDAESVAGKAEEVQDSPDALFDTQLARCKTPEEVEMLLRVTQST
jgi:hypothetical protein